MIVTCCNCGTKIDITKRVDEMMKKFKNLDNLAFHPSMFWCPKCHCRDCWVTEE